MKAYKGFEKDLKCRGMQYEVGKEYEMEGPIEACKSGFHACEDPLDVFRYYPPATSRYCEVEQSGEISRDSDDTKAASSRIKVVGEIGIDGLVKAKIEYAKAHTTQEMATAGEGGVSAAVDFGVSTAGDRGVSAAGEGGVSTAGYFGVSTAGDRGASTAWNGGVSTAGDYGVSAAGEGGVSTAGYSGVSTAGDRGASTAGNGGVSTAGNRGVSTAGDYGAATSRGTVSVGKNGCGLVRGNGVKARGGMGAVLVICEEREDSYYINEWKAVVVNGETVKADTWYKLMDGELVECDG